MTKREAERRTMMNDALRSIGFTRDECEALRLISIRLQSWFERECGTDNGCIERDETTGKAYWLNSHSMKRYPIRDMETGAMKRLAAIIKSRNVRAPEGVNPDMRAGDLASYIQGDPRGAALYIIRPGDVPAGADVGGYYSRGICVY